MPPFIGLGVQHFNALHGSLIRLVVDMDAIWLDMAAKKLQPVLIRLVVEFLVIHPYAFGRKPLSQHGQQAQSIAVQSLRRYHHAVVHEKCCADAALIIEPSYFGIEIQTHSHLRGKPPDGCADAWLFREQRLFWVYMFFPEPPRDSQFAVPRRAAMHADHRKPPQKVWHLVVETLRNILAVGFYQANKAPLYLVAQGVGEESLQIPFDDTARLCVAVTHFADVFYHLVDGGLPAHTLAVVEGSRMQLSLDIRHKGVAQQMVGNASFKRGGEYLPPFRDGCQEGIVVVNAEDSLPQLAHHTHQQRCPVSLEV